MTKSFIKEAYTNLCKDKDTIFYSIKEDNTPVVPTIPTGISSKNDCKKYCDNQSSCEIFTYNELLPSNNCKIYTTINLNNNFEAEVDCQKAYKYDNSFDPSAIKIKDEHGNVLTHSDYLGVGYVKPKFFRENQDKFKMTTYYLNLVKDIKNTFVDLKTSTQISRNDESRVHYFTEETIGNFRRLNANITKLSDYLDISNDIVFSRLIPDRTIIIRDEDGNIIRNENGNEITLQLTSSFLTEIAFDGIDKDKIKDFVENKKYYAVKNGIDISSNMYNSVHDYVTKRLLKEDKQKNQLLGDLENIENNLTRSNILYLFLFFLFISIIIVFLLYKFKFKFMNDIRIIIFLLGIVIIVVLLHFLIK
jgi:hypothetical protein